MPLSQDTFGGYFGIIAIELTIASVYDLATINITAFFLSMGLYLGTFSSHFETIFKHLSQISVQRPSTTAKTIKLKECLINAIELHTQAKE